MIILWAKIVQIKWKLLAVFISELSESKELFKFVLYPSFGTCDMQIFCHPYQFVYPSILLSQHAPVTGDHMVNMLCYYCTGVYWPIQSFPEWGRIISHLGPVTYPAEGVRAVLGKGTYSIVMLD